MAAAEALARVAKASVINMLLVLRLMAASPVIPRPDNGEAGSGFLCRMRWPGPPPVAVPAQPGQSEGTSTAIGRR
jgi:hypothetical protein